MKSHVSFASALCLALFATGCERDEPEPEAVFEEVEIDEPQQAQQERSLEEQQPGVQQPGQPQREEATGERQPVAGMEEEMGAAQQGPIKVELKGAEGVDLEGHAEFSESDQGVKVVVTIENAPKNMSGPKGVHIHEKGDCSNIRGDSMGGHFAPQGDKHALPSEKPHAERHLGDLGNIDIQKDGSGKLEFTVEKANLEQGDKMSFLGKAIVMHEGKDVGAEKQPSGSSGSPIACGVIERK